MEFRANKAFHIKAVKAGAEINRHIKHFFKSQIKRQGAVTHYCFEKEVQI